MEKNKVKLGFSNPFVTATLSNQKKKKEIEKGILIFDPEEKKNLNWKVVPSFVI